MKTSFIFLFIELLIITNIHTTIIKVPSDERTIQAGINAASDGDTVLVDSGTYVENISFRGKNIVVGSLFLTTFDTTYISRTVIYGGDSRSVVMFQNREKSLAVLTGFTITNGYADGDWPENCGGGIYCDYNTSPTLINLRVIGNEAINKGGGIFCYANASPTLVNVTVSGNAARIGGGIYFEFNSKPNLKNVTVNSNIASYGGGIYCYSNSSPTLVNVRVSDNIASTNGGGIQCYYSSPLLVNVTVSGNTAYRGGGIFCGDRSSARLANTILWNNLPQEIYFSGVLWNQGSISIAYSNVKGGKEEIVTNTSTVYWLEGNMNQDPRFVDAENGDFYLQENSPCIDVGTAFFVLEGDTLVNLSPDDYVGSAPDMGAFEVPYTIVGIDKDPILPNEFVLYQNYPNPFNAVTTISYQLPEPAFVNLSIYNVAGQFVERLVNKTMQPGIHHTKWRTNEMSSGLYFYKVTTENYSATNKCLLLK